jgi:hypothetical protein
VGYFIFKQSPYQTDEEMKRSLASTRPTAFYMRFFRDTAALIPDSIIPNTVKTPPIIAMMDVM